MDVGHRGQRDQPTGDHGHDRDRPRSPQPTATRWLGCLGRWPRTGAGPPGVGAGTDHVVGRFAPTEADRSLASVMARTARSDWPGARFVWPTVTDPPSSGVETTGANASVLPEIISASG